MGIIKHDKVLEGQTGEYVFEMLDFYRKKEEKEKIRQEKGLAMNEERMKLLPKLLLDSVGDQKYPFDLLKKIVFSLYLSKVPSPFHYLGLEYSLKIDVTPNTFPVRNDLEEETKIFKTAVPLSLIHI